MNQNDARATKITALDLASLRADIQYDRITFAASVVLAGVFGFGIAALAVTIFHL